MFTNETAKLRGEKGRYRHPITKGAKPLNLLTDLSKLETDRRLWNPNPKNNYNNQQNWNSIL
jgi:hypothetical protein